MDQFWADRTGAPGPDRSSADQVSADTAATGPVPVFADPSGQRRRLVRLAGAGASALCVGALVLVGIGLFGGPKTPFRFFGGPRPSQVTSPPAPGHHKHGGSQVSGPGPGSSAPGVVPSPGLSGAASPSPSPDPRPRSSSPSPSPTSTSRTPPAHGHTRSPHPHPTHSHKAAWL